MTLETVRALSDAELSQVAVWAQEEIEARREKRKQEAIAKIKELAGAVGVAVSIKGQRGRPTKAKSEAKPVKKAAAKPA
jgi:DNA-binding protein H-NS